MPTFEEHRTVVYVWLGAHRWALRGSLGLCAEEQTFGLSPGCGLSPPGGRLCRRILEAGPGRRGSFSREVKAALELMLAPKR